MNCWPSGKYVLLLYMHSIHDRGSFCFNYSLNSGVAWRWSVCGTAEVVWKPRFLWQWPSAHLHFLVSCFSFFSWKYSIDSLCGSDLVSLPVGTCIIYYVTNKETLNLAGQSSTPTPRSFNQLLVLLAVWAGAHTCEFHKSKCIICKLTSTDFSYIILFPLDACIALCNNP